MALAVTHSTAADGTFSATGSTAWDAAHTLTGTVATAQIADDAVTYAKIQDVTATDRILGRITTGAGIVEELTAANVKTILAYAHSELTGVGTNTHTQIDTHIAGTGTAVHGLGTISTQASNNVSITGGSITGITDIALADGGTGASLADPGADRIMFWDDSAGVVDWLIVSTGLTITDKTLTASGGGASLDAITAAVGDQAGIANADWNIRWNWQKTTNSEVAFEFGESAASTNGTSTSGVPNQVLAKFSTVAASTMSPLSVYSRATHVFSVAPDQPQIYGTTGSATNPTYSFTGSTSTGMYFQASGTRVGLAANGTAALTLSSTQAFFRNGTVTLPSVTDTNNQADGLSWPALSNVTMVIYSGTAIEENARWAKGEYRLTKGTADAVSYAINARKSRGTVASPTVITTGDDLLTISGYGYVGATNTYQEAARITFDSTGTISDSATGIGGIIRFHHAIVGAEPAEVGMFRSQHLIHEGTSPTITANGGTNPTIAGKDEAFDVTIGTGGTATDFTVTFANAFTTNAPVCIAQSNTDIVALKVAATTTTVTVTSATAFTAGSIVHVICRGWE